MTNSENIFFLVKTHSDNFVELRSLQLIHMCDKVPDSCNFLFLFWYPTFHEVSLTVFYYFHFSQDVSLLAFMPKINFVPSALVSILGTDTVTGFTSSFQKLFSPSPKRDGDMWYS